MKKTRLVDLAQQSIAEITQSGDIAIDATVGNGHDTAFLARQVGINGTVYGFDIQRDAIQNTRSLLGEANLLDRVLLHPISHEFLSDYIPAEHQTKIRAIMFNLGYLPGGDKSLITRVDSTLLALTSAVRLIGMGGRISIVAYPGHPGGTEETEAIKNYTISLPAPFNTTIHSPKNPKKMVPVLFVIEK